MNLILQELTDWLDKAAIKWAIDADGWITFRLDWGSSHYGCSATVEEQVLKIVIEWGGRFIEDISPAASFLTDLAGGGKRGHVWMNRKTGRVIYRFDIQYNADREYEAGDVDYLLNMSLDTFHLMIFATQQVIAGAMTQQQARDTYNAAWMKIYGPDDDDPDEYASVPPTDPAPTSERLYWRGLRPYQGDDRDPMLN